MFRRQSLEMRVLILAPIGRDAALIAKTIAGLDVETAIARDGRALLDLLAEGAGSALIAEEALNPNWLARLGDWIAAQPSWSDTPFIVLTFGGRETAESHRRANELRTLGNFTLIERPARPDTLQSAVRAALRARLRQYEIRSQQEALLQANADLEQFAHSASHDLREPLRSIALYSELLADSHRQTLDARGVEVLGIIESSARRMDVLLTDLRDYAQASSIAEENLEPIESFLALTSALENLAEAIRESEAKITVADLPAVKMRNSHLALLFQNLIGNAIKYRHENRPVEIQVTASLAGNQCTFRVADNGIGVPAAYQETIFGIFKRLHSNGTHFGTGMGLAICKRIVERYRGRIWVESELGEGSTFVFCTPA